MRKSLGLAAVLSLFFLSSASAAELNLSSDPLWKALVLNPHTAASTAEGGESQRAADPPDCSVLSNESCDYYWNPEINCCVADGIPGVFACPTWCV